MEAVLFMVGSLVFLGLLSASLMRMFAADEGEQRGVEEARREVAPEAGEKEYRKAA
jgi:hypothetical protein